MKIAKAIHNEYVFSIFSKIIIIPLSFLHSVLVARYLGAELTGTSTYITNITAIGYVIITFGIHHAYPYFRKIYGKEKIYNDYVDLVAQIYTFFLAVGLIIVCVINLKTEIKVAIMMMPIMGYASVTEYICLIETPNRRNRSLLWLSFGSLIIIVCFMLLTKRNLTYAIILLAFLDVAKCIVFSCFLEHCPSFRNRNYTLLLQMIKLGFFPMLALLMTTLNYKIDVLMLKAHPEIITMAQIGVYSIGISVSEKICLLPDGLKGILASKLAKGATDEEVAKVCRLCFISSVMICFVLILAGRQLISLIYGAEFAGGYEIVLISALGSVMIGFFKLIAQYNIINRKQINNFILLSISILINVIGNYIFIPLYGIRGAALSTCLAHIICGVVFTIYFSVKTKISFFKLYFIQKKDIQTVRSLFDKKEKRIEGL